MIINNINILLVNDIIYILNFISILSLFIFRLASLLLHFFYCLYI